MKVNLHILVKSSTRTDARDDDLLMLNITKQVVQMHSTATELGTAVDGKSHLAKILIKRSVFNVNSERSRQMKVRDRVGSDSSRAIRTQRWTQ